MIVTTVEMIVDDESGHRFIDLTVPHHASNVAGAVAAATPLEHQRLREITTDVVKVRRPRSTSCATLGARLCDASAPMLISKQILE